MSSCCVANDAVTFPGTQNVCGCPGTWTGQLSLALPKSNSSFAPANLCGNGFDICTHNDMIKYLTADTCYSVVGSFVVKFVHAVSSSPCVYDYTQCTSNEWPVCCGIDCATNNGCKDAVWPGVTRQSPISLSGQSEHCNNFTGGIATGVLCCGNLPSISSTSLSSSLSTITPTVVAISSESSSSSNIPAIAGSVVGGLVAIIIGAIIIVWILKRNSTPQTIQQTPIILAAPPIYQESGKIEIEPKNADN
jgi:hypothetical protein